MARARQMCGAHPQTLDGAPGAEAAGRIILERRELVGGQRDHDPFYRGGG
jgi:hypothetical protein